MRFCLKNWFAALGLMMMAASSGSAGFNLILNGSFEEPTVPTGEFTLFPVGSNALTDWNVIGSTGVNVATVDKTFQKNGVTFNAEDGSQSLDLTGDSNAVTGVSQTVTTTIGDQYQLSYYVGNTTGGSNFGTFSRVEVYLGVNGTTIYADTNSNVSPTNLNWEQFTHTFVATSTATEVAFENLDLSSDSSNAIDNVVLTDLTTSSTAVPAPPGFLLAGIGALCLAGYFWQQRKPPIIA